MISEFMLQQTQVDRVIPKYLEFIDKFPSIRDLSTASNRDIIRLWSGLGYNRRAIWLRDAAKYIKTLSYFPRDYKELRKIKGIGPYTSRSILIFAFNQNIAAVDINIRRILIHEQFANIHTKPSELLAIAFSIMPAGRSRDWHNALMDLGSLDPRYKINIKIKSNKVKSTFKGSTREIRGKIIRMLISDPLTLEEIYQGLIIEISQSNLDLEKILSQMIKDQLVQFDQSMKCYYIST